MRVTFMAAVLIVWLVSVGTGAKPDVLVEKVYLGKGGVPCLVVHMTGVRKAPVVFVCHGYGGRKENHRENGAIMARKGFFVVIPDAAGHGERSGSSPGMGIFGIIDQSCAEIVSILDGLAGDPRADASKAGIAGFSMGAMTSFAAPTMDKRFAAAAPWCGNPQTVGVMDDADAYYPCAILSQHGRDDHGMPAASARRLFERMKPYYKQDPGRLKVVEYPGVGHTVVVEMVERAADWFERYLK